MRNFPERPQRLCVLIRAPRGINENFHGDQSGSLFSRSKTSEKGIETAHVRWNTARRAHSSFLVGAERVAASTNCSIPYGLCAIQPGRPLGLDGGLRWNSPLERSTQYVALYWVITSPIGTLITER